MISDDMTRLEGLPTEKKFEVWTSFARQALMQAIWAEMVVLGLGCCTVTSAFTPST